ncbi:MAG: hypothetical protein B7Z55_03535, partial [Planctomycetales bacterium 12-60-4]
MSDVTAYRARWIVPVDSRPIEDGVLVVADGRIVSIVPRWPKPCVDLGNVALIPGLVNCHTHLEFSQLTQPILPFLPFTDWIRAVIGYRREHPDVVSTAIRQGLQESLAGGVTLLGDIATSAWNAADYTPNLPVPRTIVFQEFLGLGDERIAQQRQLLDSSLHVSPHAPYSTHPELFASVLKHAEERRSLVAVHLAETAAEVELLEHGTGEFREFLQSLGLWREGVFGGRSCRDWLEALSELPRALVIHGNYLSVDELAVLARAPHMTLVYCPRTHAAFGHPPHRWVDLLNLGGSVAIATDGRSSNPDLSLWKELQFLAAQYPEMPPHLILKLGTLSPARALGQGQECGSLSPGKRADVAVVSLESPAFQDPLADLFAPGNDITATMLGGRWAYSQS